MTLRKILKFFGLMKIEDARLLSVAIENKRLENLKQWLKDDAPNLYNSWKNDAEGESEQWINEVFLEVEKSEWFIRKGK
jgi:hypothetical protein|tara:strand:+ start:6897 stop:7133 length:237 start_codon:yes stop_codon:yes gene_type:complete